MKQSYKCSECIYLKQLKIWPMFLFRRTKLMDIHRNHLNGILKGKEFTNQQPMRSFRPVIYANNATKFNGIATITCRLRGVPHCNFVVSRFSLFAVPFEQFLRKTVDSITIQPQGHEISHWIAALELFPPAPHVWSCSTQVFSKDALRLTAP